MEIISIGAFAFAAVAAVAAVAAARWEWLDLPNHAWRFNLSRDRTATVTRSPNAADVVVVDHGKDAFSATVKVYCEGDLPVRDVALVLEGVTGGELPCGEEGIWQSVMTSGVDPLVVKVDVPAAEDQVAEPYVEVRWTTLRPLRRHGERLHLRSQETERWRWSWRRLRLRRRPGERWWRLRPVRAGGRWVRERRNPLAEIPTVGKLKSAGGDRFRLMPPDGR